MNARDTNQDSGEVKYITKKVTVNGQFVTLYSSNGQTWVSSPEDIPSLMERLENARITLNTAGKAAEGEGPGKVAKPAEPEEAKGQAPKVVQAKYRMKGPKPRPILRQGGKVIQGTPIEPISASSATLGFSSDVESEAPTKAKASSAHAGASAKAGKNKQGPARKKMIAPVLGKPPGAKIAKAKLAPSAKPAKDVSTKIAPQVAKKVAKPQKGARVAATEASNKKAPPKKEQPIKKSAAAKKTAAQKKVSVTKKSAKKGKSGRK